MGNNRLVPMTLSGRYFSKKELRLIKEKATQFTALSRTELARELSKELSWYQSNGKPKHIACMVALKKLESLGYIKLPALRKSKVNKGTRHKVELTSESDPGEIIEGQIEADVNIELEPIQARTDTKLWKEYIERYHYLGYKGAFGSQQKYFIWLNEEKIIGCLLYSASAWSVDCRDKWIGWSKEDRAKRLHLIINNSRFLILPWIKIKNLASKVLSKSTRQVREDWQNRYNYCPVLLESFVDHKRNRGICYRASNWKYLGRSKGRGKMDRNREYTSSPKEVFVYPLTPTFRKKLRGGIDNE